MNMPKNALILLTMVLFFMSSPAWAAADRVDSSHLNDVAGMVADKLDANLLYMLDRAAPILYTSFVDLSRLDATSPLGVLLGDQVASRFSQHGFRLTEIKLMKKALVMKENTGEFALSRDIKRVVDIHDAQAVLVGTYTLAGDRLFISAKLVDSENSIILSSCYFSHVLDKNLLALSKQTMVSMEAPKKRMSEEEISGHEMDPLASGMILLDPKKPTDAKLIQIRLSQLKYYDFKIDGRWGKRSREALVRFKKDRGLAGGGRFDMDTQKVLFQ